jgi:dTDP-glucose pyrophosphorylase
MSLSEPLWSKTLLPSNSSISQAIKSLEQSTLKIVLIVNNDNTLIGTISDGDIRRGLLKKMNMDSSISSIINKNSLIVTPELDIDMVKQLMLTNKIQQIPIVDEKHNVIGLHLWDELDVPSIRANKMIIMAGGLGSRLLPHTLDCPKPLLKVSGKPILEHIIDRAKHEGFYQFILAINYLGFMIEEYFGNGEKFGVEIEYLREKTPLGTAGALSLLNPIPKEPLIVNNGDVITDIRYGELLDFHQQHNAVATMAVRSYEWQHPFGVVNLDGTDIIGLEEKPTYHSYINSGIYVLDPSVITKISSTERFDMTTLFEDLQIQNKKIIAYPMHETWLDIGRPGDLSMAPSQL